MDLGREPLLRDVAIAGGRATRIWQGQVNAAGVGIEIAEVALDQDPTPAPRTPGSLPVPPVRVRRLRAVPPAAISNGWANIGSWAFSHPWPSRGTSEGADCALARPRTRAERPYGSGEPRASAGGRQASTERPGGVPVRLGNLSLRLLMQGCCHAGRCACRWARPMLRYATASRDTWPDRLLREPRVPS